MFTGIIQGLGRVSTITKTTDEIALSIEPNFEWDQPLEMGESIAVSGVCLTVTSFKGSIFSAFVSGETVSRTTLSGLKLNSEVNLERALRLSDRLGGHLVSGHVDGLGRILKREKRDKSWFFEIRIDQKLAPFFIEKGSVTVEGISLTVNSVSRDSFSMNIIPHTLDITTLNKKLPGDEVNIETDMIGKYVARLLGKESGGSNLDKNFLAEHGFI